jgi:hypothetical protein
MENNNWKMKKAIHLRTFAFVLSENLPLKGLPDSQTLRLQTQLILPAPPAGDPIKMIDVRHGKTLGCRLPDEALDRDLLSLYANYIERISFTSPAG